MSRRAPSQPQETHAAIWRRLDTPGHDAARLAPGRDGWVLEGAAVFLHVGLACSLRYSVETDERWHTRRARVAGWAGPEPVDARIEVGEGERWSLDGAPQPALDGCIDVDLAFTPATNTLPLRRLGLAVGSSRPVTAAWLRFPELVLEPLDQVYSRESPETYRYASSGGSFQALLSVDREGLVVRYPGSWQREDAAATAGEEAAAP